MGKILVIGASGTVGSELSKILKDREQDVLRATSQKNLRPDQVHLNLVTGEGFEQVGKVEKLFLLSPPNQLIQEELLIPMIDSAGKANLKKVVLLTSINTSSGNDVPLRNVELHLEQSGIDYNIIRPNWFMQNFSFVWAQVINASGKLQLPVGDAKVGLVDTRDVARVAAELLLTDKFNRQAFDITGPEAINHQQVVEAISKVTGRKITFENISSAQMSENLSSAGFPEALTAMLVKGLEDLKNGKARTVSNSVEKITGKKPTTFQQYAEDYKKSWMV